MALSFGITAAGQDSVVQGGTVTAPGAGASIVTAFSPGAGSWIVTVELTLGGAAAAAADVGNLGFQKNGSTLFKLANSTLAGQQTLPPFRITLAATDTIGVVAVGAGTAGVVYSVNVSCQSVA